MIPRALLPVLALALTSACAESDSGSESDNPTLVGVDPQAFLGTVPCEEAPGAMRRYVATLFDVLSDGSAGASGAGGSDGAETFALPSSPPIDCNQPVAFGFVVPSHRYVAEITGFDRTDLVPIATGAPTLLAADTGEVVPPRWTTRCTGAAVAATHYTARIYGCDPLTDHGAADPLSGP
jgi:hypothetical protein